MTSKHKSLVRPLVFLALVLFACPAKGAEVDRPLGWPQSMISAMDAELYIALHRGEMRRKISDYNLRYRVMVPRSGAIGPVRQLHSIRVRQARGDNVLIEFGAEVRSGGSDGEPWIGSEVFELRWIGRNLEVVGHLGGQQPALSPSAARLPADGPSARRSLPAVP